MSPIAFLSHAFAMLAAHVVATYGMGTEDGEGPVQAFDCSAWIWFLMGEKKNDRNTDWILADACGKQTKFRRIDAPVPGCIAVYGTKWVKGERYAGHVGVVVNVARHLVIDSSSSQNGPACHKQDVLFTGTKDGRKPTYCVAA